MNPIGAIIVASFAVFWVAAGTHELRRRMFLSELTVSVLISVALIFAAIRIPPGTGPGFDGKIYGIVVTLEAVTIAVAATLLNRAGVKQYLIPVIAFIVGTHFFGMVTALHSNEFWWVGGAMCLLPILTLSFLSHNLWAPVVGVGCAIILWLSVIFGFR